MEREPPRPCDFRGLMQTKADDSTVAKPHYIKVANVEVWYSESPEGNRPSIRAKVTFQDGRVEYISAWRA